MSQPLDSNKTQKDTTTTQRSSNNQKSADWTREETEELLVARGPKKEQQKRSSAKKRGRIWSEIYDKYKTRFVKSVSFLTSKPTKSGIRFFLFKCLKALEATSTKDSRGGFKMSKEVSRTSITSSLTKNLSALQVLFKYT